MVGPVRPVGWCVLSAPRGIYALCYRLGRLSGSCCELRLSPWIRLPLAGVLRRCGVEVPAGRVTRESARLCMPDRWAVEPWQPWPAHEPFADEVTRWWPSDDWPPAEPPIIIEDRIPDVPPDIINWKDRGGWLDLWM